MVILLVTAMFIVVIAFSYWRERTAIKTVNAVPVMKMSEPIKQMFLHPSHTFAKIVSDDVVEVGMDDFAKHAFGSVDHLELPPMDKEMRQGDVAWQATIGTRKITQRMPLDGRIIAVNKKFDNWILKIKPSRLQKNVANLIDSTSVVSWLKMARMRFLIQYSGAFIPAKQDGGELVAGFARHLTDEQWKVFAQDFFNSEE